MPINSNSIYRTNSHKNLGVHFDQHLEFNNHHIQSLKSAYATLNSLHSLKYLLPTKSKLILIDSLIFSKATYANAITFPNISKSWLLKYHRLSNVVLVLPIIPILTPVVFLTLKSLTLYRVISIIFFL